MAREKLITGIRSGRTFVRGDKIGGGEYGNVYIAHENDTAFALKLPTWRLNRDHGVQLRVGAEIQRDFNHPHITKVEEIDETRDTRRGRVVPFMVTPLADMNLGNFLGENTLKPRVVMSVANQTSDALAEVHRNGLLFVDLKLDNYLVFLNDQQGAVTTQLNDFSQALTPDEVDFDFEEPFNYGEHAPEYKEWEYTFASEQYEWASKILYPAVVGQPFGADSKHTVNVRGGTRQRLPFWTLVPAGALTVYHEIFETVADRALQEHPGSRYPSMSDLHENLTMLHAKADEKLRRDKKIL